MRVTDLDLDLETWRSRRSPRTRRHPTPARSRPAARLPASPGAKARQSIRSRISRTRSIEVCGCRNANLATVSPSHADGGMKAT